MTEGPLDRAPALLLLGGLAAYWLLAVAGRGRGPWPWSRLVLWTSGILVCLLATTGPLAELAHTSFPAHMVAHLLLGMLGPLLLVLAAPVTLVLRALPTRDARRLVRVLSSAPLRLVADPVTAAVLDLGGLWVLYTTRLFGLSQHHPGVHLLVHAHVLLWGYLFTAAVVGRDPVRHRRGQLYRATVLVGFLAGHGVLAKFLYAYPPAGVAPEAAELGAMLMYYGGDLVDVAILVLCGRRWYVMSRPRSAQQRLSG
jgi:putative membrane protein